MRCLVLGLSIPFLAACRLTGTDTPPRRPEAGAYRGDHGAMTGSGGLESELILSEDGRFRYFRIASNTAFFTAKGDWSASEKDMVWTGVEQSFLFHGGFKRWDSSGPADTSYLRRVTGSGFERLEVTQDSLHNPVLRWVGYRRIVPEPRLPEGTYEFAETYPDPVDTAKTISGLTRLEVHRDGHYVQRIFRDGVLYMSDVDSLWTQAGSYLITSNNRHCDYEPGGSLCASSPPDYEYVARLAKVGEAVFSLWMSPDFSFQEEPFWADFRKVEDE